MKKVLFSLVFCGLLFASPVMAGDHHAASGSQVQAAGPYYLELDAQDGQLEMHVTDLNRKAVQTSGGSATAYVYGKDGDRTIVKLHSVFGNLMKGSGDFKITPDTKISVLFAMDPKSTYSARFTPKAGAASESAQTTESDDQDSSEDDSDNGSSDDD